jgi:2-polyprenyl-6-methoxyphenol hydroxylase-like FAD-dependent oxidoreductase
MSRRLDILISGGGIGGLTAALALRTKGHSVTVCETARQIEPMGVGINLLPHAVAVLDQLGLLAALRALSVETSALVFANRHGQTIYRDERGIGAGYSHPQLSIHRGHLHLLLWDEAGKRLGADRLFVGERVVDVRQETVGVTAEIARADGCLTQRKCDVLIAADGIHSAVRRRLFPGEGPPRWNGMMMWRGTTLARPFLDGRTMVQAGHRRAKFVAYPISPPADDGTQLINWICDRRINEAGIGGGLTAPEREDWNQPGLIEDLLPTFSSWRFDWLDIPDLLIRRQQILKWPMVDRDPLPRWRHGHITLLGDAAHPMYPIGSNGATQAIIDAGCIADALNDNEAIDQALDAYESERRPMTSRIVELNRQEGLDFVLDMVEDNAPNGFERIEDVIDPAVLRDWVQDYKAAAGHKQRLDR